MNLSWLLRIDIKLHDANIINALTKNAYNVRFFFAQMRKYILCILRVKITHIGKYFNKYHLNKLVNLSKLVLEYFMILCNLSLKKDQQKTIF